MKQRERKMQLKEKIKGIEELMRNVMRQNEELKEQIMFEKVNQQHQQQVSILEFKVDRLMDKELYSQAYELYQP